jgi:SAM-dependent methyltransferase
MFAYVKEVASFDIRNGTVTSFVLKPEELASSSITSQDVPYMPSFSKSVRASHRLLLAIRPESFEWPFIDVGCGSGKALILWAFLNQRQGLSQKIAGAEIDKSLVDIANFNITKVGLSNFVSNVDALSPEFQTLISSKCVLYLYNPFGLKGVRRFIHNISSFQDVLLVYVNPQHIQEFTKNGFSVVAERKSWHQSMDVSILERSKRQ